MQGCGHPKFMPALRQYLRDNRPDVVGLVEPRISGSKADSVIAAIGFPHSYRIEAAGYSGGIWLCWYSSIKIDILVNHFQFLHFRITCIDDGNSALATLIYASPNATKRKCVWSHLNLLAHSITQPWILFGDFNATLSDDDRMGCALSTQSCPLFRKFVFDNGLRDMGFSGPQFTWQRGGAQARLDRFLCNMQWDEAFPESSVHHLLRMKSDHRPLLLQVGPLYRNHSKPRFQYFTGWRFHEDFRRMVKDSWLPSDSLSTTINSFARAADIWNGVVFGFIGNKKRALMARLRGVQRTLCSRRSAFLTQLEKELLLELENILDQEEMLWRQKSRSEWIHLGDRNTSYFHKKAKIRKVRNRITSLQISDGSWCDEDSILKDEAVCFYKSLFSCERATRPSSDCPNMFPRVDANVMSMLDIAPSPDEIRAALMGMAPLKAPGLDGLHAEFFQKNWDIASIERYPHFHDLMTPSGSWDVALLLSLFPTPVAHRILSIRCPDTSDGVDFCYWRWHDRFTVREAYLKCMENSLDSSSTHWDAVWQIWDAVCSGTVSSSFYTADLHTWLLLNLRSRNILAPLDVPWNILFGSVCWHIWKCRNEYVFAGSNSHPDSVALHSIIWARHYYTATVVPQRLPSPLHDASPCQWSPPPSPWICLNTDGGVCKSTNIAKAGGLFRDNCGTWIRGYGRCIGIADPLTAELWAIHDGLILAWDLGFEMLQVQSDCAKAISTLTASTVRKDSHALIRSIHSLCQRGWEVDFVWIPREANQVVDQLVKDLPQSQYERVCIDGPPAYMSDLLSRDIHGPPYSRGSA
ncbi:hypothetical protein V6N13_051845 [Hibiscus sabdariffa]